MLTMLLGVAALALDGSNVYAQRAHLSAAADAAAIAAARHIRLSASASAATIATGELARMGITSGSGTTITVNNPPSSGPNSGNAAYVEVMVSRATGTFFAGVLGFATLTPGARAVAGTQLSFDCLLALDTSGSAINVGSSGALQLGSCIGYANANAAVASSGTISASRLFLTGTCSGKGCPTTGLTTGAPQTSDPLGLLPGPTVASPCNSRVVPKNSTATLDPGCYTNLTINGGSTVTLRPGVYNVTGTLSVQENSLVTGAGVLVHMSGSSANMSLSPTSNFTLSAQTTGNLKAVLIYQDRGNTNTLALASGLGSGAFSLSGLIYAPSASVEFGNESPTVDCAQLIGKRINFTKNATVYMKTACAAYGGTPVKTATLAE